MEKINESKIRDIKKSLPDKNYHIHSNIDLWINLTVVEILNYEKLLGNKLSSIKSNKRYNNSIIEENINKEKIEALKKFNEGSKEKSKVSKNHKNSILGYEIPNCELFFIVKLFVDEMERKPSYQTKIVFNTKIINQYISFKFKIKDLTEDCYITIDIYSVELEEKDSFLGRAKVFLFDKNLNLYQGRHSIKINNNQENNNEKELYTEKEKEIDILINSFYGKEYEISENYYGEGEEKEGIKIKDSKMKIEEIKDNYFYNMDAKMPQIKTDLMNNYEYKLRELLERTNHSFIVIRLPSFKYQVIFEEEHLKTKTMNFTFEKDQNYNFIWIKDESLYKGKDFNEKDNPVTERIKFFSEYSDMDLAKEVRLNPIDEEKIANLLNTPDFIDLGEEKKIFWKYRYELLRNNTNDALTKIINSVNWNKKEIYKEFFNNILKYWKEIEMCDILYILSRKFSVNKLFMDDTKIKDFEGLKSLRKFAVRKLRNFTIDEINFMLLQLVQAIKYEDISVKNIHSPLVELLIEKSKYDLVFASSLYWFIECESNSGQEQTTQISSIFCEIKKYFLGKINDNKINLNIIKNEIEFKNELEEISSIVKEADSLEKKKIKLNEMIDIEKKNFMHNEEHCLPIDPKIRVKGIFSDGCTVFNSAKKPIKYTFKMTKETKKYNRFGEPKYYRLIYKFGDDLRQDQLILQMINFMKSLLKKGNADFEFTLYKVLATSKSDGFVEFVPNSKTYFDIKVQNNNSLKSYFKNTPGDFNKKLVKFMDSLAGYCAVNYILGIGDRHDQNVMFSQDGSIFHIDFGYILGNEPNFYSFIPFKISKDMVECMGGKESDNYKKFCQKCVNAYLILRENARTIVNMFYIMIDADIEQLKNIECLETLYKRFSPELNKEQAKNQFLKELNDALGSFTAEIKEKFHKFKQDYL